MKKKHTLVNKKRKKIDIYFFFSFHLGLHVVQLFPLLFFSRQIHLIIWIFALPITVVSRTTYKSHIPSCDNPALVLKRSLFFYNFHHLPMVWRHSYCCDTLMASLIVHWCHISSCDFIPSSVISLLEFYIFFISFWHQHFIWKMFLNFLFYKFKNIYYCYYFHHYDYCIFINNIDILLLHLFALFALLSSSFLNRYHYYFYYHLCCNWVLLCALQLLQKLPRFIYIFWCQWFFF